MPNFTNSFDVCDPIWHVNQVIVIHLLDRGDDSRGVADGVDNPCMGKKDVHDTGKYRGITRLSHVLNVLEIILDGWIIR